MLQTHSHTENISLTTVIGHAAWFSSAASQNHADMKYNMAKPPVC